MCIFHFRQWVCGIFSQKFILINYCFVKCWLHLVNTLTYCIYQLNKVLLLICSHWLWLYYSSYSWDPVGMYQAGHITEETVQSPQCFTWVVESINNVYSHSLLSVTPIMYLKPKLLLHWLESRGAKVCIMHGALRKERYLKWSDQQFLPEIQAP